MAERRQLGDRLGEGDAHRWLSRLRWFAGRQRRRRGRGADGGRAARGAAARARASDGIQQPRAAPDARPRRAAGRRVGSARDRPRAAAGRDGDPRARAQQPRYRGAPGQHRRRGRKAGPQPRRSRSRLGSKSTWPARTPTGAASRSSGATTRSPPGISAAGIAYCRDRDLDPWLLYMTGWMARLEMEQGRWDDAAESAISVLKRRRRQPAEPDHAAGRARAAAGPTRRPRPVDAARRGFRTRIGDRGATASAAGCVRPRRGQMARGRAAGDRVGDLDDARAGDRARLALGSRRAADVATARRARRHGLWGGAGRAVCP